MNERSGKRPLDGIAVPRKGPGLILREPSESKNRNTQLCNRIGCSGRLTNTKGAQIGSSDKPKLWKPCFRSSSGKDVLGISSKTSSNTITNVRKSLRVSQKKPSPKTETDSSESSSVGNLSDVHELVTSSRMPRSENLSESSRNGKSSKVTLMEVGRMGTSSNTGMRKVYSQKSSVTNPDNEFGSTSSSTSESSNRGPRENHKTSMYGLKNLRSNSNSESSIARRGDVKKKRNTEGESSSSIKGKEVGVSSSIKGRGPLSTSTISISDTRQVKSSNRGNEVGVSSSSSVITRRTVGDNNTRLGRFNKLEGNNSSRAGSFMLTPRVGQPEMYQFSVDTSSSSSSSNSRSTSSDALSDNITPVTSSSRGINRLVNRDGSRRYTADGIAEVLLALERIEQDEELTYEQLLSLETNLFLGGLSFYDQHRDMRLDIDNMSYEELLALEEEMGTVSTALSEEALSKCLKLGIYQPSFSKDSCVVDSGDGDDIKCSICQEEYSIGEEIGRLGCEHGFHALCINHWLRVKKWCPICKAEVEVEAPSS